MTVFPTGVAVQHRAFEFTSSGSILTSTQPQSKYLSTFTVSQVSPTHTDTDTDTDCFLFFNVQENHLAYLTDYLHIQITFLINLMSQKENIRQ